MATKSTGRCPATVPMFATTTRCFSVRYESRRSYSTIDESAITTTPAANTRRDRCRSAFRSSTHSSRRTKAVTVIAFVAFCSTRTAPTGR